MTEQYLWEPRPREESIQAARDAIKRAKERKPWLTKTKRKGAKK